MALKETLLTKSLTSHALDEDELIQLVNQSVTNLDDSSSLPTAGVEYLGQSYIIKGVHYVCELVETVPTWVTYNSDGTQLSYADMSDKPTLDGITINGALTKAALGIAADITTRTQAASLEVTDKIPINDDEYATIDDLAIQTESIPNFINIYPKLYVKSDYSLTTSKATSDVEFVLTNEDYTTHNFTFTIDTICKLRSIDSIYALFDFLGATYHETHNINIVLYKNNVQFASSNNLNYQYVSSGQIIGQFNIVNASDVIFNIGDILKISVSINEVGMTGTETVKLQNASQYSSFFYFKEEISQFISNKIYGQTSGTYYIINRDKKYLNKIVHTYVGNATIYMDASPQSTTWDQLTDNDQEIIFYNISGATRTVQIVSSIFTLFEGGATSFSVDASKCLYIRFQYVEIGGSPFLLFKESKILA